MQMPDDKKLYIAYNEEEMFKALIMAKNKSDARDLIYDYANDAELSNNWDLTETTFENAKTQLFDCDYIISDINENQEIIYLDEVSGLF